MKSQIDLSALLASWNQSSSPSIPRSEHEHKRHAQRARAIDGRLKRVGYFYGRDWRELSNGARWPEEFFRGGWR